VTGKGTITYTYDGAGNKLKKVTLENPSAANGNKTITTTTTYVGAFVYESKTISPVDPNNPNYTDKLLFAGQEEGRIRTLFNTAGSPNTPSGFAYDYFVKDHLGNVRMMLTEEVKQDIYPAATLEGSLTVDGSPNAAYIEKNYYTINSAYVVASTTATGITTYQNHNGNPPVNNNPNSVVTANSAKLYKLNSTANKTGLGITLKVMAGDRIDILGKSYYFTNNTGGTAANSAIPVLDILTGLLSGPTGGAAAASHGGITASQLNGSTTTTAGINTLLSNQTTDAATAPTVPKAYINYIFFDDQFKATATGFSKVGSNSVVKPHTDLSNLTATKSGYVYIYVSNESPVNVFFDNLQVIHTRGAILEETHYYPFGLTMAGISSKALAFGSTENKRGYNGNEIQNKEFSDGSGLEFYDFNARTYDQQIGRFLQIDPESEENQESWSPYHFGYNNPIRYNDPDGKFPIETIWDIGNLIYDVGKAVVNHIQGDHKAANASWIDAGTDLAATLIPYVPAGATKLYKAADNIIDAGKAVDKVNDTKKAVKNADKIAEGKKFEADELAKSVAEGKNVSGRNRLVPQNGKGNVKGNRTDTDQLVKNKDGTYTIVETKLSSKTRQSTGQKSSQKNTNNGSGVFETRTNQPSQGLRKGDKIQVKEYIRKNKNE